MWTHRFFKDPPQNSGTVSVPEYKAETLHSGTKVGVYILGALCLNTAPFCAGAQALVLGPKCEHGLRRGPKSTFYVGCVLRKVDHNCKTWRTRSFSHPHFWCDSFSSIFRGNRFPDGNGFMPLHSFLHLCKFLSYLSFRTWKSRVWRLVWRHEFEETHCSLTRSYKRVCRGRSVGQPYSVHRAFTCNTEAWAIVWVVRSRFFSNIIPSLHGWGLDGRFPWDDLFYLFALCVQFVCVSKAQQEINGFKSHFLSIVLCSSASFVGHFMFRWFLRSCSRFSGSGTKKYKKKKRGGGQPRSQVFSLPTTEPRDPGRGAGVTGRGERQQGFTQKHEHKFQWLFPDIYTLPWPLKLSCYRQ